eukprot:15455039-Alexandrium_andersonii.AAC.1
MPQSLPRCTARARAPQCCSTCSPVAPLAPAAGPAPAPVLRAASQPRSPPPPLAAAHSGPFRRP